MFGSRGNRWCLAVAIVPALPLGCGVSPDPQPVDDSTLAVFFDPDSAFSTSDVHDVENQIVRFDAEDKTIIRALADRAYQPGG